MSIMRFNYRSQALERYTDITIVFPTDSYSYYDMTQQTRHHTFPGAPALPMYQPGMKFQTIYLIHGGGDDDSLTYRYTNAERYAQENHVMLVTPNISNSFGVDTQYGVDYFTFLTQELPLLVQTLFASSPLREDNFIMGYAMGGNAALGAAIRRPDLYAACVDMSGGIGMTLNTETLKQELSREHNFRIYSSAFGPADNLDGSEYDIFTQGKNSLAAGEPQPDFYLICGEREFIRDRVAADAAAMAQMGYNVTYIEEPGYDHNFDMWDMSIRKAMYQLLPLKRTAVYPEK